MLLQKTFLVTVFVEDFIKIKLEDIMISVYSLTINPNHYNQWSRSLSCLELATKSYYNSESSSAGLRVSFENGWMHRYYPPAGSIISSRGTITHNFSLLFHHLSKSRVRRQPCYCCLASRAITSTPELGSRGVLFPVHVAADRLSCAEVALPPFNALVYEASRLPPYVLPDTSEQWRSPSSR